MVSKTEFGKSNHILVIANIGVDHVGLAGTGGPQMNIFWIMTTSHMRTKSPHPNLEMKQLRPGGRTYTNFLRSDTDSVERRFVNSDFPMTRCGDIRC